MANPGDENPLMEDDAIRDSVYALLGWQAKPTDAEHVGIYEGIARLFMSLNAAQKSSFYDICKGMSGAETDNLPQVINDYIKHYKYDTHGKAQLELPTLKDVNEVPWRPSFIRDVVLLVPGKRDTTAKEAKRIDPWSYEAWSNLLKDLEKHELGGNVEYYTALSYVTEKFGSPQHAPFNIYIKHRRPIDPPTLGGVTESVLYQNREMTVLGAADYGYATWLLGVRYAIRGTELDTASLPKAFESITNWFPGMETSILAQLVIAFFLQTKGYFSTGSAVCASECTIRRGMNINFTSQLYGREINNGTEFQMGQEVHQFVTGQDAPDIKKLSCDGLDTPVYYDIGQLPHYNNGFWGFAQVGIANHGYALMSMYVEGAKKTGVTIPMILRIWPNTQMAEMNKVYIRETILCNRDPWRCVGHLLRNNILCPLSMTKFQECAYAGICLCAENLSIFDRPVAPSGINLTAAQQVIIAAIISLIRMRIKSEVVQDSKKILDEYAPVNESEIETRRLIVNLGQTYDQEMSSNSMIDEIINAAKGEILRGARGVSAPISGARRQTPSFLAPGQARQPRQPVKEIDSESLGPDDGEDQYDDRDEEEYQESTADVGGPPIPNLGELMGMSD